VATLDRSIVVSALEESSLSCSLGSRIIIGDSADWKETVPGILGGVVDSLGGPKACPFGWRSCVFL
jgi:hypothetical protein